MRFCARNLYEWQCDHESMQEVSEALDRWSDWSEYPKSWPKNLGERLPLGVVDLTPKIEVQIAKRRTAIFLDLEHAGTFYPREEVKAALEYWGIEIPEAGGLTAFSSFLIRANA